LKFSKAMSLGGLKCRWRRTFVTTSGSSCSANVAFNPVSVLTRATMGSIAAHPGTRELVLNMMQEAFEIAARLGSVPNDLGRAAV